MIPHEYIEELTRRTDIVELVGGYVQLKRKGRLYGGLCPFHSEKTPSFYVYPDTQSFYCFGCGAGGDAVTFTKKINSIDYVEAVKLLAEQHAITIEALRREAARLDRRLARRVGHRSRAHPPPRRPLRRRRRVRVHRRWLPLDGLPLAGQRPPCPRAGFNPRPPILAGDALRTQHTVHAHIFPSSTRTLSF